MPSTEERLEGILAMLSPLEITSRMMMGEYLLYVDGTHFGDVCDDRLMLKITPASESGLPDSPREPPYPGASPMIVADGVPTDVLIDTIRAMIPELPRKKACRPFR